MQRLARWLLYGFVFSLPWAYSLDLGEPWGNVARILGALTLAAALPAIAERGSIEAPGSIGALVWAYFLLQCCTIFWTLSEESTWDELRGLFQKMMVVWLTMLIAQGARDLTQLLRATVSGMAVLAALTVSGFTSATAWAESQARYAAEGQDPNDTAHFLALSLPLAALLAIRERRRVGRWLATGYFPLAIAATLLTASRGGFLAMLLAMFFCAWIFYKHAPRHTLLTASALILAMSALCLLIPAQTFDRLATIPEQIAAGTLNEREQIRAAGLEAVYTAPFLGAGAGSFVLASHTAWQDTAHNSALAITVQSGLTGLLLACAIAVAALAAVLRLRGEERVPLLGSLAVCALSAQVSTIEESRPAWLLLALIALAGREATFHAESKYTKSIPSAAQAGVG